MRASAVFLFVVSLGALACSATLPRPPRGSHIDADFAEVAEKPPPPHAEDIGERPDPNAVWIDGEWSWSGRRWTWKRGGWVIPPQGATFAPWDVQVAVDGRVLFAPGTWRNAKGEPIDAPAVIGARKRAPEDAGARDAAADAPP